MLNNEEHEEGQVPIITIICVNLRAGSAFGISHFFRKKPHLSKGVVKDYSAVIDTLAK
jgi:hypothetical protein